MSSTKKELLKLCNLNKEKRNKSNLEECNQGQVEQVSFGSVQHNLAKYYANVVRDCISLGELGGSDGFRLLSSMYAKRLVTTTKKPMRPLSYGFVGFNSCITINECSYINLLQSCN